jgi:hypothetical protein
LGLKAYLSTNSQFTLIFDTWKVEMPTKKDFTFNAQCTPLQKPENGLAEGDRSSFRDLLPLFM